MVYKKAVIKFFPKEKRQDYVWCHDKFLSMISKNKSIIQYCRYFYDFDSHVGHHYNVLLKSSHYKSLRTQYTTKGDNKDPDVFLWMVDIQDTDEMVNWIRYCHDREITNHKRFMPPPSSRRETSDSEDLENVNNEDIDIVIPETISF